MSEHARQRAVLSHLLAEAAEHERRPCRACVERCSCARRSTACCCRCGPTCDLAPKTLSVHPDKLAVHPAYVPVLFGLCALQLFEPRWPEPSHYCAPPGDDRPRPVHFRTTAVEYAGLIAQRLEHLQHLGSLSGCWRVSLVAHAGESAVSFAIEPLDTATPVRGLWKDLLEIGRELAPKVLQLARVRLWILDGRFSQLTRRQREVLDLFLSGLGVESIAARLVISVHTVRNHLKALFAKLGVASQRELREHLAGSMTAVG